jgi:hypothetical protein
MASLERTPTPSVPPEETPGLLAVIQELNAAPDLRSGLSRVAELLRDFVPYDNLSVLLLDDLGRELHYELSVGLPPEVAEHWRFGMGQGLVGTAAQTGRPRRQLLERVAQLLKSPRCGNPCWGCRTSCIGRSLRRGRMPLRRFGPAPRSDHLPAPAVIAPLHLDRMFECCMIEEMLRAWLFT